MANSPKKLAQAQLGTSDGAVFTVTAGQTWTVSTIYVCNTDTSARTFRLHHVNSGGSSAASNAIFFDMTLDAGQTIEFGRGTIFETEQMLRGLASAANVVTVTVLGIATT
jgi:hypothetical protein